MAKTPHPNLIFYKDGHDTLILVYFKVFEDWMVLNREAVDPEIYSVLLMTPSVAFHYVHRVNCLQIQLELSSRKRETLLLCYELIYPKPIPCFKFCC